MAAIRELVAHMPIRQRELVAAPARLLPPRFRYGPTYESTRREILKARTVPRWAWDEAGRRLRHTMTVAAEAPYYAHHPAYSVLEQAARGHMEPRDALGRLPILTRQEVTDQHWRMLTGDASRVEVVGSSGTSGEPMSFLLDRDRGAREWAYTVDAWAASGYRLGQWRAFFRSMVLPRNRSHFAMPSIGELMIRMQTVHPDTVEKSWNLIAGRKIRYLHGYTSTILYLARLLEEAAFDTSWRYEIRGVFPVSEPFTRSQDELLQRVFPRAKICVFYGLSEKTACAWLDPEHTYHSYPLYGHVELLDEDGRQVQPGQRGRLVTTSLDGRGMSLLRYDTGDSAEFLGRAASGSVSFRNIVSRRGRQGLVRADGKMFSLIPFGFSNKDFSGIRRFRLRQEVPGEAVLLVEPMANSNPEDVQEFHRGMSQFGGQHVKLHLEVVDRLEPTVNGKEILLDQRIPNAPTTWA